VIFRTPIPALSMIKAALLRLAPPIKGLSTAEMVALATHGQSIRIHDGAHADGLAVARRPKDPVLLALSGRPFAATS
jgi:hypothetical protein